MSGRRILSAVGGVALGLAVLVPTHTAPAAQAADYNNMAVSTWVFSVANLDKEACLIRAERAMRNNMFDDIWDAAIDDDSTVHGRRTTATALVYCDQETQGLRVLVNVHADSQAAATQLRDSIAGLIRI